MRTVIDEAKQNIISAIIGINPDVSASAIARTLGVKTATVKRYLNNIMPMVEVVTSETYHFRSPQGMEVREMIESGRVKSDRVDIVSINGKGENFSTTNLLSIKQVAKMIGEDYNRTYWLVRKGVIPHIQTTIGGRYLILQSSVEQYLSKVR